MNCSLNRGEVYHKSNARNSNCFLENAKHIDYYIKIAILTSKIYQASFADVRRHQSIFAQDKLILISNKSQMCFKIDKIIS